MISPPFILTMVILFGGEIHGTTTSFTAEYGAKVTCQEALRANREALQGGKVVLATCTPKS